MVNGINMDYNFIKDCKAVDRFVQMAICGNISKDDAIQKIKAVYLHSMSYPKSYVENAIRKVERGVKNDICN